MFDKIKLFIFSVLLITFTVFYKDYSGLLYALVLFILFVLIVICVYFFEKFRSKDNK